MPLITNSPHALVKDLQDKLISFRKLFADDTGSLLTVADTNASRVVLNGDCKKISKLSYSDLNKQAQKDIFSRNTLNPTHLAMTQMLLMLTYQESFIFFF